MNKTLLISSLTLAITACGGGAGGNSSTTSSSISSLSSSSSSDTSTSSSSSSLSISSASSISESSSSSQHSSSLPSVPQQAPGLSDLTLSFATQDPGIDRSIELWGLDTAWVSEDNIRRGTAFMGADKVDLVRVSFTPTSAIVNGELGAEESALLERRIDYVELVGPNTAVVLNADPPSVDPYFINADGSTNPQRWAELIDITAQRCENRGHPVLAAAPFNEPDYSINQGSIADFYNVLGVLEQNPRFNNIRLTGGNTLNNDEASPWYDYLKDRLDEGNTHQLAGSFDTYAGFFSTVTANGHRAVNDELHNVMEAMVGAEYGMQTGIWWGPAERARGELVKASDGRRLGYAEHRANWTAAAVYRGPNNNLQLFGGGSERQASDTRFRIIAKDRAVYFDGHGPSHEYNLLVPGGTGYWEEQPNFERVINITWGDDIQPAIDGRYILVNRNSEKVLEVADASTADGSNIQQGDYTGGNHQQWDIKPLPPRNGLDTSYFSILSAHAQKAPDVYNYGLADGANIVQWGYSNGGNQHWYLEYAGDNWFYICSRHSAKCLDVNDRVLNAGANVQQWQNHGGSNQQWRLLPVGAAIEFTPPDAPTNLQAEVRNDAIQLNWNPSTAEDLASYSLLRANSSNGQYETIARALESTHFVDHSAGPDQTYYYRVRAEDRSLNRSTLSNQVMAQATGAKGLIAHYGFEQNLGDYSANAYHAALGGNAQYEQGQQGSAFNFDGEQSYIKLPAYIANQQSISISTWVYWRGGSTWQRIFDFGNDQEQNMFLTSNAENGELRFAIKNLGEEQRLDGGLLPQNQWTHLALTLDSSGAYLYVNGQLVNQSSAITIRPLDFKPVANYLGRSQYPDPLFNGAIDEFKIFNYALSAEEIIELSAP